MRAESHVRLVMFGAPHVARADGDRIEIPETAPAYLGLFLAAQPQWSSRESVAAHLWPELPDERAQHNLRVALNRLGTLLERWSLGGSLRAERRRLRLDAASDLAAFRVACESRDWQAASEIPVGELMHGVQFTSYPALAEWLSVEREAVRRAWRKALFEAAAGGGDIDAELSRYLAAHPADGEMATLQATRLAAAGRAGEARDVIASFSRAASDQLAPDELDATVRQLEHAAAGVVAASTTTVVIGRDAELAQLQAAVDAHRWVTVAGLPGSGKSTLVQAWLARGGTPDRRSTLVVAFNAQTTAAFVADAIVDALVAPPLRSPNKRDSLAQAAGFVVLDGLDPASADDDLRQLLRTLAADCPGLRTLASSRAPLHVPGEHVMRLGGLSMRPAADGGLSDAARLFTRQAPRIRPEFGAAGHETDIERIARASGGLPLALKLAAARSRWQNVANIADELERRAPRADRPQDESLHGWLEPVWTRLTLAQRQALASLSLLPGSFDMDAAMTLSATSTEVVESLIDMSLVDIEDQNPPQLRLHALVRAFAAARLNESPRGRRDAIARCVGLVHGLLATAGDAPTPKVVSAERAAAHLDDLLAAWPLAIELGELDALSTFVSALLSWHEWKGEYRTGERRLARAVEALDESVAAEAALLARLQTARATLLYRASDYDACEHVALEARRLAEATAQRKVARRATNALGLACWMTLRLDEAKAAFEVALATSIEDGDERGECVFNSGLALVEKSRGNFAAAETRLRRVLEIGRSRGDWDGVCTGLNNLANLMRHLRRFDECEALAQECLRLSHEHGLLSNRPFALIGLALLQRELGKPESARAYLDVIDACNADSIEGQVRAGAAQLRAQLALDRGDGTDALHHICHALDVCVRNDDVANRAEGLELYGAWLMRHAGKADEAVQLWAALLRSPHTHATLRDQLELRLAEAGGHAARMEAPALDLVLVTEQAIAASRRASSG